MYTTDFNNIITSKIKFEERYDEKEYGTTTLYFIAPKEILCDRYPEAEHAEISIECPTNHLEAAYAHVEFSPTKDGCDYDWYDVTLPYDEIELLISLAVK